MRLYTSYFTIIWLHLHVQSLLAAVVAFAAVIPLAIIIIGINHSTQTNNRESIIIIEPKGGKGCDIMWRWRCGACYLPFPFVCLAVFVNPLLAFRYLLYYPYANKSEPPLWYDMHIEWWWWYDNIQWWTEMCDATLHGWFSIINILLN